VGIHASMGKSQRTKGAVFEREVAKLFSGYFGREFKRNIGQARDGGNDIDVGLLVIEAKRRASLKVLRQWMQQATEAAVARLQRKGGTVYDHVPIVVMREDSGEQAMVLIGINDFIHLTGKAVRDSLEAS
jgi:hypothetical protein